MWQTKLKLWRFCKLGKRFYCSPKVITVQMQKGEEPTISSADSNIIAEPPTPTSTSEVPPTINVTHMMENTQKSIVKTDQQTNSFDDIPGPISLRLISKFWSMIPMVGTELTVRVIQYLLSGGHFFGDLLSWGGNAPFFKKFFNVYGPVVRLHGALGSDVVLVSRPEHASAIFGSEGPHPIRSCLDCIEKYRLECRNYQHPGPFLLYGSDWQKLRAAIEDPLKISTDDQFKEFENISDSFIQRIMAIRNLQEEMPNNFKKEIYKWALECITSVALDKKLGFLDESGLNPTSEADRLLDGLIGATHAIAKCEYGFHLWKFIETPAWKSLVKHCDAMEAVLSKNFQDKIVLLNAKNDHNLWKRPTLLERLIANKDIKEDDIMTVLLDMYLIGANATTHTVSFLFYHLARNPRCQIKLYEEIKKNDITITKENLKDMKYLQACIKECLRLNPAIPILSRVLTNDVVIHNYNIPKGTHVLFAAHLNILYDEYFEDAQKFKPERWLSSDTGGFGNDYQAFASMPFGYGQRACMAKDLAETQIATLLYKICKKFKIEYNYGDIKSSNQLLASPTKPLKFRFIDRV